MRVVVTGATGNVGSATAAALLAHPAVREVVGVVRRVPPEPPPALAGVRWVACDLGAPAAREALPAVVDGADAVVHLAWALAPAHRRAPARRTNVTGTAQLLDAVVRARVPAFVHASSVAVYSPGPKNRRVDESWPTGGVPTCAYSQEKVAAERLLDEAAVRAPALRVVRLRPVPVLAERAGSELTRYFLGPLLPTRRLGGRGLPILPAVAGLRLQAVHSDDAGAAFAAAATRPVAGAFNLAAEPVLDARLLGQLLGARPVPVPAALLRATLAATWRLRVQRTPPGWLDLLRAVPLLDVSRAHEELGFTPRTDALTAVLAVLRGIRDGAGVATPPLTSRAAASR